MFEHNIHTLADGGTHAKKSVDALTSYKGPRRVGRFIYVPSRLFPSDRSPRNTMRVVAQMMMLMLMAMRAALLAEPLAGISSHFHGSFSSDSPMQSVLLSPSSTSD